MGAARKPQMSDNGISKYTKDFFMTSSWYSHKRELLEKTLEDGQEYSFDEVEQLLSAR